MRQLLFVLVRRDWRYGSLRVCFCFVCDGLSENFFANVVNVAPFGLVNPADDADGRLTEFVVGGWAWFEAARSLAAKLLG